MNNKDFDPQIWGPWVQEYVTTRDQRYAAIIQPLKEDKKEYFLFKLAFDSDPELKKAVVPTELASLAEIMRRLFAPDAAKEGTGRA
jgi:hypothetical protein